MYLDAGGESSGSVQTTLELAINRRQAEKQEVFTVEVCGICLQIELLLATIRHDTLVARHEIDAVDLNHNLLRNGSQSWNFLASSPTTYQGPKRMSIAIVQTGYRIYQTPFAQPTTPVATLLESSLCALSTPSPPRFQCVSVQAKRGTYLLPRPLPGSEGGTLGLPNASVPSFSRQSGQYHFALRAGICVMPTHSKWNHSLSHCGRFVSIARPGWIPICRGTGKEMNVARGRLTLLSQLIIWPNETSSQIQYLSSSESTSSSKCPGLPSPPMTPGFFFWFLLPRDRLTLVTVFCPFSADVTSPFGGGFLRVLVRVGAGAVSADWLKML